MRRVSSAALVAVVASTACLSILLLSHQDGVVLEDQSHSSDLSLINSGLPKVVIKPKPVAPTVIDPRDLDVGWSDVRRIESGSFDDTLPKPLAIAKPKNPHVYHRSDLSSVISALQDHERLVSRLGDEDHSAAVQQPKQQSAKAQKGKPQVQAPKSRSPVDVLNDHLRRVSKVLYWKSQTGPLAPAKPPLGAHSASQANGRKPKAAKRLAVKFVASPSDRHKPDQGDLFDYNDDFSYSDLQKLDARAEKGSVTSSDVRGHGVDISASAVDSIEDGNFQAASIM